MKVYHHEVKVMQRYTSFLIHSELLRMVECDEIYL